MSRLLSMFTQSLLVLLLLPVLAGSAQADSPVRVITTTTDLAYFAQSIGGERVTVEALARPTEDVHHVQVKPSLLAKLNRADLFIRIGLDLEPWVDALLLRVTRSSVRPGGVGYLVAGTGCHLLDAPTGRVDRSRGDVHPAGNPHCWLDPHNAAKIAQAACDALIRVDPAGRALYEANCAALIVRMKSAMAEARALLKQVPDARVIQHHASFVYLFKALGLQVAGTIEPQPGIAPGAGHLARLREQIATEQIRAVVTEPSLNQRTARSVAEQGGALLVTLGQHVDSLPGTGSWEALILENTRRLVTALKGAE